MPRREGLLSTFSHFGGKHSIIHLYPPPRHSLIIEPFAGSAPYGFRYWNRDVWVNDKDPRTYELLRYLAGGTSSREMLRALPRYVVMGQPVEEIADWSALPPGLYELAQALVSCGTYGEKSSRKVVTPLAAPRWPAALRRLDTVFARMAHWRVTNLSYEQLPNIEASWFVDAPYNTAAGNRYRQPASAIDFRHLATWCLERRGQLAVCEQEGADWLPFAPLTRRHRGISYPSKKSRRFVEVIYEQSDHLIGAESRNSNKAEMQPVAA